MAYTLTHAGYLTQDSLGNIDASDDLSGIKTEALLRDATELIALVTIPHVIDEEDWAVTSNSDPVILDNFGYTRPFNNVYRAFVSLFDKPVFLLDRETRLSHSVSMFRYHLTVKNIDVPDAAVKGNLVWWQEHAYHIALWSPHMATLVSAVLTAEYKALKGGKTPDSTTAELRALAEGILRKTLDAKKGPEKKENTGRMNTFKYLKKDLIATVDEYKRRRAWAKSRYAPSQAQ